MGLLPYLKRKLKDVVFGEDTELTQEEFKERTAKLRIGGKDWLPLFHDFEGEGFMKMKGKKIKLEK
jgi:hypothetical protein